MATPSVRPDGVITTPMLLDEIQREFGLVVSRQTVLSWVLREDNPAPVEYRGKSGQGHWYDWEAFKRWMREDIARQSAKPGGRHIDSADWHQAKTISARERAKRDVIETGILEERYGETGAMQATAEDRARKAVQMLSGIPSRVAPLLAAETDELVILRILDDEYRRVCTQIASDARVALGQAFDDDMEPDPAG